MGLHGRSESSQLGELVRCSVSTSHAHHATAACSAHLSRASSDCPPSITSPTDMTAATRESSSTCAARQPLSFEHLRGVGVRRVMGSFFKGGLW